MGIYAHYDPKNNNVIDEHYVDQIHGENIPSPSTEITEEEWEVSCDHGGECFVVNGKFVYDPKPRDGSEYNRSGDKWVFDTSASKVDKISEITAAYIAERTTTNKGIASEALGGAVIDCRESDVLNIQNLVTLLESQGTTEYFYKLKDNTSVDCTVAQIKTVLTELIAALMSMWQLKQTLTGQINAATTAEEIQAIKWEWTNQ